MAKAKKTEAGFEGVNLNLEEATFCLVGRTPYIHHCMAEKARGHILIPPKRTPAARAQSLKHDPMAEYRASPYLIDDPRAPTRTAVLAVSFKRVIESMCLDVPGLTKSSVSRNIIAMGERIPLYGIPQMRMDVVRSADMNHTPDIRTRATVPEWACQVTIRFPVPLFNVKAISDLLSIGGLLRGVGDYRPEKGAGTFGTFEIVSPTDSTYLRILATGGREAQMAAFENPEMYDEETRRMFEYFVDEVRSRGQEEMATLGAA